MKAMANEMDMATVRMAKRNARSLSHSIYLDKIIAPMVKTLSSYVKDSQHTLRISLNSILLCPILNYCILFYPILFYSMMLYYKSPDSFFKAIFQSSSLKQNSFSKF